ncbi:hypothetical protein ACTA71_004154 [Dictyostelium dimigraforme]
MEEQDLFLKIFRNKYLKKILFNIIKHSNKQLNYTTYGFYDFPLELVIKTNNQQVFKEKLNLFKSLKSAFNYNNKNNKNEIKMAYKWYLNFKNEMIELILKWKELELNLFIEFYKLFEEEIKRVLNETSKEIFERLLEESSKREYNNLNFKILNWFLKQFPEIKIYFIDVIKIHSERYSVNQPFSRFLNDLNKQSIIKYNEYLFEYYNHCNDRFFKEAGNYIYDIIFKNDEKGQNEFYSKIFEYFPPSKVIGDSVGPLKYLFEILIQRNSLKLLKLILLKLNNLNLSGIEIMIPIFNFNISSRYFDLNTEIFNIPTTQDSEMMQLFGATLKSKLILHQLKGQNNNNNNNNNNNKTFYINGPDYSDFTIELKKKTIDLSLLSSQPFIFKHTCLRTSLSLSSNNNWNDNINNEIILNNCMDEEYYKSSFFNENLNWFDVYIERFGFNIIKLKEIVQFGFNNMVEHVLKKRVNKIMELDKRLILDLFILSLPNDNSNNSSGGNGGSQLLINYLLPKMNEFFKTDLNLFFENELIPINRIKRIEYFKIVERIQKYSYLRSNRDAYQLYKGPIKNRYQFQFKNFKGSFEFNFLPKHFINLLFSGLNCKSFKSISKCFKIIKRKEIRIDLNDILKFILFNVDAPNIKIFFYLFKIYNYELPFTTLSDFRYFIGYIFKDFKNNNYQLFDLSFGINQFKNFNLFNYITLKSTPIIVDENQKNNYVILMIDFYFQSIGQLKWDHFLRLYQFEFKNKINNILYYQNLQSIQDYYDSISKPLENETEIALNLFGLLDFIDCSNDIKIFDNIISGSNKIKIKSINN